MHRRDKTNIKETVQKYGLFFFTVLLLIINIFLFQLDWQSSRARLTLAVLDVGQGDAIFIESPTGAQVLVDAGPPRVISSELLRVMPPFDRTLDAIIITNPDQDHIGGFLDVLEDYKVGQVFEPGTYNSSKTYQSLKNKIQKQNIPNALARQGVRLHLGGGAFLDILFPDRDVSLWTPNDGSVVARLSYGSTSVILMGDATTKTEKIILGAHGEPTLKSTVLKVGHHGSRTSTSDSFARAVSPDYALISSGKNNKYNHPHPDVLDVLDNLGIKVLRTDTHGTIIMKSDGQNFEFSFDK